MLGLHFAITVLDPRVFWPMRNMLFCTPRIMNLHAFAASRYRETTPGTVTVVANALHDIIRIGVTLWSLNGWLMTSCESGSQ